MTNQNISWDFMPGQLRCPVALHTPESREVLRWWTEWKTLGVLPWEGEMGDQPQFVLDALSLCEETLAKSEREKRQALDAELKRKIDGTRRLGKGRH